MKLKNIAIITARGGSKRIKKKNIRDFHGKPIISYVIEAAINSRLFDEVMVSTEDSEIARIAREYGALVPFYRSLENADDFSTTSDVLVEVLEKYRNDSIYFDNACCLYPTGVFATPEIIKNSFKLMINENFNSVLPIVKFQNSVMRSLSMKNNRISFCFEGYENSRSQDLDSTYYDPGQFYWFKVAPFLISKKLLTDNTGGFELNAMNCHDIDTEEDWNMAELKYALLQKSK